MSYVELSSAIVFGFLEELGFEHLKDRMAPWREVVFSRAHERDPAVQVWVYTSIAGGRTTARERGKDAIRVALVVDGRGAWKSRRVHRTGTVEGVLARVRDRAREAYAVANGILKTSRCPCGGRRYGDSGRCMNGCRGVSKMFDRHGVERAAWVKDADGQARRVS